jgi:hypothetical protein
MSVFLAGLKCLYHTGTITLGGKRCHPTGYQKVELGFRLEPIETELAERRRLSTLKNVKEKMSLGSCEPHEESRRVKEIISKEVGLLSTTCA